MEITVDSTFIDGKELVSSIKEQLDSMDNKDLNDIREENHKLYYDLDIMFIKTLDSKYKESAKDILDKYYGMDPILLLKANLEDSKYYNDILKNLDSSINSLKQIVKKDLLSIIDYVDRCFLNIDISNVTKSTALGILILNKYENLKIYSSNIDINDLNTTMKRQSKRLIYMQELNELIYKYNTSYTMYNKDNTKVLLNNLYTIVGDYLHLLTDNEYQYTKEAIKKILSYKFDFIDKYIHTYKIIITKIWKYEKKENFYFIRSLDLEDNNIYLMNDKNIKDYDDTGYVCDIPKYFISYFNLDNLDIISLPLPNNLEGKYKINTNNVDVNLIKIKALYTTKEQTDSILPVIYINKNE